jgi:hypothetical protein
MLRRSNAGAAVNISPVAAQKLRFLFNVPWATSCSAPTMKVSAAHCN